MKAVISLTTFSLVCLISLAGAEVGLDGLPPNLHRHIIEGQKKIDEATKPEQFTDDDFSFTQLEFKPALKKYIEVSGKAQNMSGKNFETARFTIKIYDAQQHLLASKSFYLSNFVAGQAARFNFYLPQFDHKKVKSYEIHFEEGYYF
jgi:SLAP domain-containing protein